MKTQTVRTKKMSKHNKTIRWELKRNQLVYHNELMLEAIELALQNMQRYPDAEKIIQKCKNASR